MVSADHLNNRPRPIIATVECNRESQQVNPPTPSGVTRRGVFIARLYLLDSLVSLSTPSVILSPSTLKSSDSGGNKTLSGPTPRKLSKSHPQNGQVRPQTEAHPEPKSVKCALRTTPQKQFTQKAPMSHQSQCIFEHLKLAKA